MLKMAAETHGGFWSSFSPCRAKMLAVLLLVVKNHIHGALGATVYFNSYGQCNAREDFSLGDEVYTASATGAHELHETLICDMTFRAPLDSGICLTFREFHIQDSSVSLIIYEKQTASGVRWKKLTTDSDVPDQMCTAERFVTLRLHKTRLNYNKGYSFEIQVEKSSNLSGEDVILASSIGLFVGIIVGVVALIIFIAVIVLCCCCKPCHSAQQQQNSMYSSSKAVTSASDATTTGLMQQQHQHQQHAVPSAPPAADLEDERSPLQQHIASAGPPLYPALPQHQYPGPEPYPGSQHQQGWTIPEQPPPYDPPPYEQHLNSYPTKV